MGYALLWASKWLMASIVLQENIWSDGINQAVFRISGDVPSGLDDSTPIPFAALINNLYLLIKITDIYPTHTLYYRSMFMFLSY